MARKTLVLLAGCICALAASAHDFSAEIARFNATAAGKRVDSEQVIAAKLSLERAMAEIEQADVKMLLRIRSLTNAGLKALGEQPAFLASEIKRLETALANPRVNDPAKVAEARDVLEKLRIEKKVYDTLEASAEEQMKRAQQLVESAPAK